MKRILLTLAAAGALALSAFAQPKELHILSANDMHAKIQNFPQLAAIADSLRAEYPSLLILSAGDNRTGDPLNDIYEIPAYPMVALMNQVGFKATTLGNHEFDSGPAGLTRLINLSTFDYICCNVIPDPSWGMHLRPYEIFDVNGMTVGIVGIVQIGISGHPDSHPDNCKGFTFLPPEETLQQYSWLRDKCDVVILLSHIGYEGDVDLSARVPWIDLIVSGHSHTQLAGGEIHNGVMITQNVNRLQRVTHTTLTVDGGKVTAKQAENIEVQDYPKKNRVVELMTDFFCTNPEFERVVGTIDAPFTSYEELGILMADSFREMGGADVGFCNYGGVRYDYLPAGPFTVSDILKLDPFGNDAVELTLTGEELRQMLLSCCAADEDRFPVVSGITCELIKDKKNPSKIKNLVLYGPDGKKLNLKNSYKVVTNTYVASISTSPRKDQGRAMNYQTAQMIQDYVAKQGHLNYAGRKVIKETLK